MKKTKSLEDEKSGMEVTVAIPAYNEEKFIGSTVKTIRKELLGINQVEDFEIIISEGGSTDSTAELAERLHKELSEVRYLYLGELKGKGEAVTEAYESSDKDYFIFMDADGATDAKELETMVTELEEHDVVIGSRRNNRANRDLLRDVASNVFNYSVRALFFTGLQDHQCGFKGFNRNAVNDVIESVESNHWFWDTEFLVKVRKAGLDIKVLYVDWEEKDDSEINLLSDGLYFSRKLVELRVRQWIS